MNKFEFLKKQRENRMFTMPILSFPAVQLLDITVNDLVNSSLYQANAMKKVSDLCPTSVAVTMMDLSVEAEAFGANIRFFEMDIPTVIGKIIDDEKDANSLPIPEVGLKRDGIYIEAIRRAKKLIKDRPVFAGVIGPYSLAGRLMDMTEIMINCYENPDMVHSTLKKVSRYIKNYILEFKKAGADGIIMAEPAAGLLSPDLCKEFSSKYVKEIADAVKDDNFVFVYHNCGNVVPLVDSIIDINADIYHFGNAIDIEEMLKKMPRDKLIMGNIDPSKELKNGTIESVTKATLDLLNRCNKYDNFVISSGCDIPPMAKWENIQAYFEAVQSFYK